MGVKIVNHIDMMGTTSSKTPAVFHSCKRPAFGLNIFPAVPFFRITKSTLASHSKLFVSSTLRFDQYTMETENLTKSLGNSYPHPRKQSVDEIFKSMESWATDNILPMLKPAKECWQPHDFLPHPCSYGFHDQLRELQARTKDVPDDYFVVLVGNMITEEALPTYQARINATEIFHDQTGIDETPWAIWARGWSAEENRHGDLLNKYLYLSGRLDMKQVETTIQYLIAAGMDIGTSNNPYLWTIYTSFQERATAISHRNTAKLAMHHGDTKLAQICGIIASDEKRHESAYTKIAKKLFEIDPNGMLVALAYMMRRKIGMPAHLMYDGKDENLFKHFSEVASRIGVYTAGEYRGVLEHLIGRWNVDKLTGLSSEGGEAQDYICGLPQRIAKLEEIRVRTKVETFPTNVSFSWIINNCDR